MLYKYKLIRPYNITVRWSLCNCREWVLWLTSLLLAVKSYLWLTQSARSRADELLLCLGMRAVWDAAVLVPLLQGFFPSSLLLVLPFTFPWSPCQVHTLAMLSFVCPTLGHIFHRELVIDSCSADCFSAVPWTKYLLRCTSASQGMVVGLVLSSRVVRVVLSVVGVDLKLSITQIMSVDGEHLTEPYLAASRRGCLVQRSCLPYKWAGASG